MFSHMMKAKFRGYNFFFSLCCSHLTRTPWSRILWWYSCSGVSPWMSSYVIFLSLTFFRRLMYSSEYGVMQSHPLLKNISQETYLKFLSSAYLQVIRLAPLHVPMHCKSMACMSLLVDPC